METASCEQVNYQQAQLSTFEDINKQLSELKEQIIQTNCKSCITNAVTNNALKNVKMFFSNALAITCLIFSPI